MCAAVLWFRRDLRLSDHPALLAAAQEGPVLALFVLDDALRGPACRGPAATEIRPIVEAIAGGPAGPPPCAGPPRADP